ncbi:unnamed protein product [Gongylonema pulchrum]|uniref:STAS domain-containing protein n=1 Tax=Gongylonema pulchrum TaxID=637853 RepID=A0A183EKA2_9BILA|nr:unnamed protein product [Gongylonema pulchrum]
MLKEKERIYLIIDASGFTFIDYTGVESLKNLSSDLRKHNIVVMVAASKAAARSLFARCNIYNTIPAKNFFPSVHDAVLFAKAKQLEARNSEKEGQFGWL